MALPARTTATRAALFLIALLMQRVEAVAAPSFNAVGNLGAARQGQTATLLPTGKVLIAGGNNGVGNLNSAELYDPATGRFTATGTMTASRAGHTATLLPNGKVLIAGGYGGPAQNTAELYDPATGTFAATGSMTAARGDHTATLLPNGKVLITGGSGAGFAILNSSELYDNGVFAATGSLTAARQYHTATLLRDGRVLIAGGYNGAAALNTVELYSAGTFAMSSATMSSGRFRHTATVLANGATLIAGGASTLFGASLNSADLYDSDSNEFAATGITMIAGRQSHTATLLPNGKVLLAGGAGNGASSAPLNTAELYNPVPFPGSFASTANLTAARWNHSATLLPNGDVLIAAGQNPSALNSAERYDPTSGGTFTTTTYDMITARRNHTATLLPDGTVLITGGNNGGKLNTAVLYQPFNDGFVATGDMTAARDHHTATLLPNGKVLIAGGRELFDPPTAELYDSATGVFTATAGNMTAQRKDHTATLLPNGKVLIAKGTWPGSAFLNSLELYDPATDSFTAAGGTDSPHRSDHTATLLPNGTVLLAGGYDGSYLNTAEQYDPATGTITAVAGTMTSPRAQHTATLLPNGKVLIAGGHFQDSFPFSLKTAELFDPAAGTFTLTGSMSITREYHTATLVPSGKVFAVGGENASNLRLGEVYDPAVGTFTSTGFMADSRRDHSATLLPNGKVLVAGGHVFGFTVLNKAELFDVGLGYVDTRRPVVVTYRSTVVQSGAMSFIGARFRGDSEASSGSGTNSATNHPLLRVQRVDNEQTLYLSAGSPWNDTNFTSTMLSGLAVGYYRVTIVTNAIPSTQMLVLITDFGTPSSFSATAMTSSQVALTWSAVSEASSYEIYKSTRRSGPYTLVATVGGTSLIDGMLDANTTYLYKVRAVRSSGSSDFTPIDPATTVVFSDASLGGTTIQAAHFTQLRTAVNAMRVAAEGLPAFDFTNPPPAAGAVVLRQHLVDLRAALDAARSTLGLTPIAYTEPTITAGSTTIKAVHLTELRAGTQ